MELSQLHIHYLQHRHGASIQAQFCTALADHGYPLEAALLRWYAEHGAGQVRTRFKALPWADRRIWVGAIPPRTAQAGDIWFDIYEVMPMILVPRDPEDIAGIPPAMLLSMTPYHSWMATRPVAQWQFQTFLALSTKAPQICQIAPPFQLLSAQRIIHNRADQAIVTNVTRDEALLYSMWFHKGLPSRESWRLALNTLANEDMKTLWDHSTKEWVMDRLPSDEGARLAVTPESITIVLDEEDDDDVYTTASEKGILYGEWGFSPDIGFRTSVHMQLGLIQIEQQGFAVDNIRILDQVKREHSSPG